MGKGIIKKENVFFILVYVLNNLSGMVNEIIKFLKIIMFGRIFNMNFKLEKLMIFDFVWWFILLCFICF